MLHYFLLSLVTTSSSLNIVRQSLPSVVKDGEDAELFCEADDVFDSCYWYLPSHSRCGPLTPTQSMCRSANNIHFNGSTTICKILIKGLKNDQSGDWTCSLHKDGTAANSTMHLTKAMQAQLDWEGGIFGTVTLTEGNPRQFTCQALHSRPVGTFIWHLGEDDSEENRFTNEMEIIENVEENQISNVTQVMILDPKPQLNDKKLFCAYIQEDENGQELFKQKISFEISVHYLSSATDTSVVQAANSGEDLDISLKFEALPRPAAQNVVWEIVKDGDTLTIEVEEEHYKQERHYIVYPLQQESEYEYTAKMTILNISQIENDCQHLLRISNRINSGETLELVKSFDIQVDRIQIAERGTPMTTIIIIIVIIILITIILVIMATVYAKNNDKWCFQSSSRPYINPDISAQKEPLQVQHHPYARPSA